MQVLNTVRRKGVRMQVLNTVQGIQYSRLGLNEAEKIKYVPVEVTPVHNWETEESLLMFLGRAASMSRLSDSTDAELNRKRVLGCIKKGHHSILEHANFSVIIDCDRGTTHAIVRHRHCAFTQSSTVYGKFEDWLELVSLPINDPITGAAVEPVSDIEDAMFNHLAEDYTKLRNDPTLWGERTRDHLPISLHARLFMTANLREWLYFIQRRKDPTTSVRIHCVAFLLENLFKQHYPVIYTAMQEWYEKHPL